MIQCTRSRRSTEDYTVQRHVQLQWIYRGYGFFQALLVLCASRGCESTCVGGCVVVARYAVGCVRRARMQKRQVASRLSAKSAGLHDHMHKTYKKCQKSCACGTWETSISTRKGNAAFCRVKVETVLTVLFLQRNFCLEVEFTLTDEAYPPYRWSMCLPVTLFLKKPRCLIPLLIKSKTGARVRRCRGKIKGRWGDESLSPTHKRRAPAWGNHCCCTCTVLTHVESALTSISQYNVHNIMHCTLYASVIIPPLLPHDCSTVY